ncbi:hypothetical protein ACIQUU_23770 [Streptomyces sp. NPDC101116]|uniref:hypothetical protein n=1 Tax=Streptomyces sp. NPDC101116 TaxID=3366107 RepID=UPI003810EA0B
MAPSLTDGTDDTDGQEAPAPFGRERPSRLIDVAVALLLLIADAVILVVAAVLLLAVGMGRAHSPYSSETVRTSGTPVLTWLVIWGVPAVAAAGAVVHVRLRMPVTAVVQGLFTLACTVLAIAWTRMLLS